MPAMRLLWKLVTLASPERSLAFVLRVSAASLLACGHLPESVGPTAPLKMRGGPPQATVTIDDQLVGTLDVVTSRGVALPAGTHHVSIEAAGFFPWDGEIRSHGEPIALDVALVPIPD